MGVLKVWNPTTGQYEYVGGGSVGPQGPAGPVGPAGGTMPAGSIMAYASTTPPSGWVACDGASYATATYPNLFAVIGYSFGGSGANFNVPNLKGRTVVGIDAAQTEFDVVGEAGGSKTHTHATHSNHGNHGDHQHWNDFYTSGPSGVEVTQQIAVIAVASSGHAHQVQGFTQAAGAVAHDAHSAHDSPSHLPPYMALPYIIKT